MRIRAGGVFTGMLFLIVAIIVLRFLTTLWTWSREEDVTFKDRPVGEYRWCQPGEVFMWSKASPGMGKCGKIFYNEVELTE